MPYKFNPWTLEFDYYASGSESDPAFAAWLAATPPLYLNQASPQTITASPKFSWLTATRIPYAGVLGVLTDSASITTDGTTITAGGFTTSGTLSAEQLTSTDDADIADKLTVNHIGEHTAAHGVAFDNTVVMGNNVLTTIKTATFNSEIDDGNSGAAGKTIDWTTGSKHKLTVNGAATITLTDPVGPTNLILKIVNGGSAAFGWTAGDEPKWAGGTDPAWTASGTDLLALYFDGTTYYGSVILDAK